MNGPVMIGILAVVFVLAGIYSLSDETSVWPQVGAAAAGAIGLFALELHWLPTLLILALAGAGWFAWRNFDGLLGGYIPSETPAGRARRGLQDEWRERFGGDRPSHRGRRRRHARAETRDRADRDSGERQRGQASMSHEEALELLGLDIFASQRDIKHAHRRLMKRHHPDRGGSTEMAARLNRARERLQRV